MKCAYTSVALVVMLVVSVRGGDVVTPTGVKAVSEFGAVDVFGDGNFSSVFATSLIDGSGLVDDMGAACELPVLQCLHDNHGSASTMWHAGSFPAGLPGGTPVLPSDPPPVNEQVLEFDLGSLQKVTTLHIWQMNQGGAFGALAPDRGVDRFTVSVSADATGDTFAAVGGELALDVEAGTENVPAQVFNVLGDSTDHVRRVRFHILSAHNAMGTPKANEFVGLSEVRFEAAIPGDLNLDNGVDAADAGILFANWGMTDGLWRNGDITGDDIVDAADAGVMFENWTGDSAPVRSVPEPTGAIVWLPTLLAAWVAMPKRR